MKNFKESRAPLFVSHVPEEGDEIGRVEVRPCKRKNAENGKFHLPQRMTIPPEKRLRKAGGSLFCTTLTCGPLSLSSSTVRRADAPFSLTVHSSPGRERGREGERKGGREGGREEGRKGKKRNWLGGGGLLLHAHDVTFSEFPLKIRM